MKKISLQHNFVWIMAALLAGALMLSACGSPAATSAPAATAAPAVTETLPTATEPAGEATEAPIETQVETQTPAGTDAPLPATEAQPPEGWKTYTDPRYGFSLAVPEEWDLCEDNLLDYSRLFCEPVTEPAGVGPLPRLYVSIIPKGMTYEQQGQVYNFLSEEAIQGYIALQPGESQLVEPNAMAPEYFTYTRLPDVTVAGQTAAAIENSKVWEAPPEATDRRILLVTPERTYLIGAYYETPEELALFEQILAKFEEG